MLRLNIRKPRIITRHFSTSIHALSSSASKEQDITLLHPLVQAVTAGGGSTSGVAVRQWSGADGGSGFGLQASHACKAGTSLITLPASLHLTYDLATADPRLASLINQVPAELWGAKLALQLLSHRLQGDEGQFSSYIANLPQGFPGLPMFFPPEAVQSLSYPPVSEQVKKRCRWLLGFARDVLEPLRGGPNDPFGGAAVDANALGWAMGAVTSRAFRTRGLDKPAAMLPLIDMANHSFDANAKIEIVPDGRGSLSMVASRDLVEGEPILISYGALPNDFFLLDYGFIVPGNPYDTVQLRFDRNLIEAAKAWANVGSAGNDDPESPLAPLPAWQADALTSLGLHGPSANLEVNILQTHRDKSLGGGGVGGGSVNSPVDPRLLAGTRVLCAANKTELAGRAGIDALGIWSSPLSVRNEVATLRTLSGVAILALSQLPGSEDDDVELLRAGVDPVSKAALSSDVQLAVRFRLEKKILLTAAIAALGARIKEIQEGAVEFSTGSSSGSSGGGAGTGGASKNPAKKNSSSSKKEKSKSSSSSISKGFGSS